MIVHWWPGSRNAGWWTQTPSPPPPGTFQPEEVPESLVLSIYLKKKPSCWVPELWLSFFSVISVRNLLLLLLLLSKWRTTQHWLEKGSYLGVVFRNSILILVEKLELASVLCLSGTSRHTFPCVPARRTLCSLVTTLHAAVTVPSTWTIVIALQLWDIHPTDNKLLKGSSTWCAI